MATILPHGAILNREYSHIYLFYCAIPATALPTAPPHYSGTRVREPLYPGNGRPFHPALLGTGCEDKPRERCHLDGLKEFVPQRYKGEDDEVTIWWVPAHSGASGNEVADEYAKTEATGGAPLEDVPEVYPTRPPSPV